MINGIQASSSHREEDVTRRGNFLARRVGGVSRPTVFRGAAPELSKNRCEEDLRDGEWLGQRAEGCECFPEN